MNSWSYPKGTSGTILEIIPSAISESTSRGISEGTWGGIPGGILTLGGIAGGTPGRVSNTKS